MKQSQGIQGFLLFAIRIWMLCSLVFSQFGAALQPAHAAGTVDVGIVLPGENGRWLQDKARFEAALSGAGFTAETIFSQEDAAVEKANVEALLAKGIQVLIICPVDGAAAAAAVEEARLVGVKVIAYDRLVMDTPAVDFYVTFDNIEVGQAQGQYLVDHAVGTGNPLYLYAGAASDNNAFLFFEGAWTVLQPKISDGTFVIENSSEAVALQGQATLTHDQQAAIIAQITTNWDYGTAKNLAEANLAAVGPSGKGDVFILAPNDGTARPIADVFAADGEITSYVITGQDAEKASIQYIIDGKQSMTVFKDIRTLVDNVIVAAETFLGGGTPIPNATYNNGLIDVPAFNTPTVTVDVTNLKAALIDTGYYDICDFIGLGSFVCLWYAYGTGSAEETALLQVVADAEAADPTLDIIVTQHSFNTLYTDYETAVSEGRGPDMFIAPNDNLGNEVRANQLLNLDSYLSGHLTNVTQTAIDGMKVGGVLYGVPESAKAVALYYNKSLVTTPPTTTAELSALLTAGETLAAPVPGGAYFLYGFWGAFGGQLMDNTGRCIADQGGFEPAMQYLLDLKTAGATYTDYEAAKTAFLNGTVGMFVDGPWDLADMQAAMGSDLGVAVLPQGPADLARPMSGIDGFYVNPKSQHPQDAADAALLMTNQASSQIFTDTGGHIPVRTDVSSTNPLINTFALASTQGEPRPQNEQLGGYWGPFDQMIQDVLNGVVTPADGIRLACWQMNQQNGFPSPNFSARFPENEVHGYEWPLGASVTMTIDDPSIPGSPDFSDTQTVVVADWDPNQTWARFQLGTFILTPDQLITMTDGTITKTHTVTSLTVTAVDPDADTVSGTAAPNSYVEVGHLCDNTGCAIRRINADGAGNWVADFSIPGAGTDPDEQRLFDIQPGTDSEARQPDDDGDTTNVRWYVPNPNVQVRANFDNVQGQQWPLGDVVTIKINGGHSHTATVGIAPWDASQTYFEFNYGGEVDIKAGDIISVTDGTITRFTTVSVLSFTDVDLANNIVSGIAGADAHVDLWICDDSSNCNFRQSTIADATGHWQADFSGIYDIVPGTWIDSSENDASGNGSGTLHGITINAIDVTIGGVGQGSYSTIPGSSRRVSYTATNSGPVKVAGATGSPILAAQRILYYGTGTQPTSFVEMMGLPDGQLDKIYWFPWYKNDGIVDTQLRIGNVSPSDATVHIYVAGVEVTGSPFTLTTSGAGQSQRLSFALNDGPVKIVSDQNIVATERLIYFNSGVPVSFSEMLGLPNSQLSNTYWFPWYKNVGEVDTQLRIGNVSPSDATVHIYIAGVEVAGSPFTLTASGAGQSQRLSFPINNGPVKIVSDVNIVAAQRILYYAGGMPTSFVETMGIPDSQLGTTHWFPWYKNDGIVDTQLRIGNVSGLAASVHVYIGTAEMVGSPFTLMASGAGQSLRLSFTANDGPVKIVSDQNIVTSERLIYFNSGVPVSFSEMMGLPDSQLSNTYWLPWYKNVGEIDTQLRFGMP